MIENGDFGRGETFRSEDEIDSIPERVLHDYGEEYAQGRAGDVLEATLRLGLNSEFVPILARHLMGLHLVVVDRKKPPTDGIKVMLGTLNKGDKKEWAYCVAVDTLDLSNKIDEINEHLNLDISSTEGVDKSQQATILPWVRRIVIDDDEVEDMKKFRGVLIDSNSPLLVENATEQLTNEANINLHKMFRTAIDWNMYEQSMVILSDTYYLRNTFGKYIPDINLHTYDRGQFAMSAAYLSRYSREKAPNVGEDLRNLMSGFGLMMLRNSLVQHDLVDDPSDAEEIVQHLSSNRPLAFNREQVAEHIQCLVPKPDVLEGYAELSNSFYDPDIDDEELN